MKQLTLYTEEGDELPYTPPTEFVVCWQCRGSGKSSAYLGAFTQSDMAEDPEFFEDYMAGCYDRTCDACGGLRVIEQIDIERFEFEQPEVYALWTEACDEEAAYQRMCEAERRMGA